MSAAAANEMNVLHKGWTCRHLRTTKKGKVEYLYFNQKLALGLQQGIVNGITRKQLPVYLKLSGNKIPHSTMWTARSMFETFVEVLRVNSAILRNSYQYERSEYRTKLQRIRDIESNERLWAKMEQEVQNKLTNYITQGNPDILHSFQEVREQLANHVELLPDDANQFDILSMMDGESDEED